MVVADFFFDLIAWAWNTLVSLFRGTWRVMRGVARTLLPGQPRLVHNLAALALVALTAALAVQFVKDFTTGS